MRPFAHGDRLRKSVRNVAQPDAAIAEEETIAVHPWFAVAIHADIVGRTELADFGDRALG